MIYTFTASSIRQQGIRKDLVLALASAEQSAAVSGGLLRRAENTLLMRRDEAAQAAEAVAAARVALRAFDAEAEIGGKAKAKQIVLTKGHREDQPGLRGHSVGDLYPFVIQERQQGDRLVFDLLHVASGRHTFGFQSYEDAAGVAIKRKRDGRVYHWLRNASEYGDVALAMFRKLYTETIK